MNYFLKCLPVICKMQHKERLLIFLAKEQVVRTFCYPRML